MGSDAQAQKIGNHVQAAIKVTNSIKQQVAGAVTAAVGETAKTAAIAAALANTDLSGSLFDLSLNVRGGVTGDAWMWMALGDVGESQYLLDGEALGLANKTGWIVAGPHMMFWSLDPAGVNNVSEDFNNGGPNLMWKEGNTLSTKQINEINSALPLPFKFGAVYNGTMAHLMVPVDHYYMYQAQNKYSYLAPTSFL